MADERFQWIINPFEQCHCPRQQLRRGRIAADQVDLTPPDRPPVGWKFLVGFCAKQEYCTTIAHRFHGDLHGGASYDREDHNIGAAPFGIGTDKFGDVTFANHTAIAGTPLFCQCHTFLAYIRDQCRHRSITQQRHKEHAHRTHADNQRAVAFEQIDAIHCPQAAGERLHKDSTQIGHCAGNGQDSVLHQIGWHTDQLGKATRFDVADLEFEVHRRAAATGVVG